MDIGFINVKSDTFVSVKALGNSPHLPVGRISLFQEHTENWSLTLFQELVSSAPRPFGEKTFLGLIKCRQKQKKKQTPRQNPPVFSSKEASGWEEADSTDDGKCSLSSMDVWPLCIPPSTVLGTEEQWMLSVQTHTETLLTTKSFIHYVN